MGGLAPAPGYATDNKSQSARTHGENSIANGSPFQSTVTKFIALVGLEEYCHLIALVESLMATTGLDLNSVAQRTSILGRPT